MARHSFKSTDIPVERISDAKVYESLKQLMLESKSGVRTFVIQPIYVQSEFETSFQEPQDEFKALLEQDTVAIESFRCECGNGISVRLRRFVSDNKWQVYDVLQIVPSQDATFDNVARVVAIGRNVFKTIDRLSVLDHLAEDQRRYIQGRESSLSRLESMQDDFFRKISTFTTEQAAAAQTNQLKLEEVFQKRAQELEAQHAELRRKLDEEKRDFEDRKKELDLRDSTVVRRSIRDEVKKLLVERKKGFSLSKEAQGKLWPVVTMYSLLLLIFGGLAVTFIIKDFQATISDSPSPWLVGRQVALLITFAVTAGFFIRWLNGSAQRHADEEFQTRKYELDFERASFVVEWAMEWSKDQKDVPQFLIERLSRGLFDMQQSDAGPATAADAVASALFGSAASAKLKIGGNEIVLDRKGIGRLKKADGVDAFE